MSPFLLAGLDIGGTKCAVCLGRSEGPKTIILDHLRFPTPPTPALAIAQLTAALESLLAAHSGARLDAIGISCGGPLDSRRGLVLSPPNLPGWDHLDIVSPFREHFGAPTALQNDANAGALAEWKWGAGRGLLNLIFLTFGTGLGAGLILDGRLYSGTNDLAGEVGHFRLEPDGPVGFGKAGSFEGYCSGGGIAQLARRMADGALARGEPPLFCPSLAGLAAVTAESVGLAAQAGDPLARAVFQEVARHLGRGLALIVDLLNPQRIILGSIFARQRALLEPLLLQTLRQEAIPLSLSVCEIVPAGLGEEIGLWAGLAVARHPLEEQPHLL